MDAQFGEGVPARFNDGLGGDGGDVLAARGRDCPFRMLERIIAAGRCRGDDGCHPLAHCDREVQ